MKKFTDSLKAYLTDPAFYVAVALLVLAFIPFILKMARKVPGVAPVLDKLPLVVAFLGLMLGTSVYAATNEPHGNVPIVTGWQAVALLAILFAPALLAIIRGALRRLSLSGVAMAALGTVLAIGSVKAADQVIHKGAFANSLILRPPSTDRPMFRAYSANRSNYFQISTNAGLTLQIGLSNYTGFTGDVSSDGKALLFKNGVLVSTNGI
jgi:hypothetical protein